MFIAKWAPLILLLALPGPAAARQSQAQTQSASDQQQDPLAAAARRAREAKKDQAKPAKVWDNETLAATPGAISIVGPPPAPSSNPNEADGKSAASKPSAADKSAIEADLSAAKANLQSLKVDLDLLQRKYALDQQTYYGTPGYASDTAGAAALADEKSQIDSKQRLVADAEKKVADLQAQLDAANKSSNNAH